MKARCLSVALTVLLLLGTDAVANVCPSSNTALDWQAARFEPGWSGDGTWINFVAPSLNYGVSHMYEGPLGTTPLVTVRSTITEFRRNYGWLHLSTHGATGALGVEWYNSASARNSALAVYRSAAGGSWTTDELITFNQGTTLFGLGLTTTGLRRGYWQGSFVHFLCCFGSTMGLGLPGVVSHIGYDSEVPTDRVQADDRTVIERLAGFHDFQERTLGRAIAGTSLGFNGRDDLELAPSIDATDLVHNQEFAAPVIRYVHFTSPMNSLAPAESLVRGTGCIRVKNIAWQGDDQLSFTVVPMYRGEGRVKVLSDTTRGFFNALVSMPGGLPLVGNVHGPSTGGSLGTPGTTGYAGFGNFETRMVSNHGGQNPAAMIASYLATFDGAVIHHRFLTEVEDGTASFFLQRSPNPDGPFLHISSFEPHGPGMYECDDPMGRIGDYYELWEVTTTGDSIRRDATRATWETSGLPDPIISQEDGDRLIASQLGRYPAMEHPDQILPVLQWAALIPDETWREAVQPQADFWASRGMLTGIFTLAEVGGIDGEIDFVKHWATYGLRYWLRVGSFNNSDYHNNPLYYRGPVASGGNGWSNAPYPSQPQYRVLPVWYGLDPSGLQSTSTTNFTPEAPLILSGDVDGDSLSDIAVGIWPARTPAEAALMGIKQRKYFDQVAHGNTIAAWADVRTLNNNDGPHLLELFEEALAEIPATQAIARVYATDTNGGADPATRQMWGISSLASQPNLLEIMSTTTTRVNWTMLNKLNGFSWPLTPSTSLYPHLIAGSCNILDWERSEDTVSLPGRSRPLMAEAMLDTLHGPATACGFPRGTFAKADQYFLLKYNRIGLVEGASSGGEAFMIARREVAREYPEYKFQFMTGVYFGDPALPIKGFMTRYSAGADLSRAQAPQLWSKLNPSRGWVELGYVGGSANQLSIYDLAGRRLWMTELQMTPGIHTATWDGQTLQGQHAAPGLYLARTNTGRALKVTLLR